MTRDPFVSGMIEAISQMDAAFCDETGTSANLLVIDPRVASMMLGRMGLDGGTIQDEVAMIYGFPIKREHFAFHLERRDPDPS